MNLQEIVVKIFENYLFWCSFLSKPPTFLEMKILMGIFQELDYNFGNTFL